MPDWMQEAPMVKLPESAIAAFQAALNARNPDLIPPDVPRWLFLQWLAREGYLLHGAKWKDLEMLRPAEKNYAQPDEFSNRIGVYATSDGLWPMMYALRGPQVKGQNDMGLQVQENGVWSPMKYFLSYGVEQAEGVNARELMSDGVVYVLETSGFEQSPSYQHEGLGYVQEAHWVHAGPVTPVMCVPVTPNDFPLRVNVHDDARVRARAKLDPWGFPWLSENEL